MYTVNSLVRICSDVVVKSSNIHCGYTDDMVACQGKIAVITEIDFNTKLEPTYKLNIDNGVHWWHEELFASQVVNIKFDNACSKCEV